LLPEKLLREDQYSNWVAQPMPDAFSNLDHADHAKSSPPAIKAWFDGRPFRDPVTNMDWGGPGGVRLGFFLLLRMLVRAESPNNQPQDSPTASPTLVPVSIVQYTCRALMVFTNHLHESIKILESTASAHTLATNQNLKFQPMHHDQARYEAVISPIEEESDNITISSGGPLDAAANLLEPVCSPRRITSAPDLGKHPATGTTEVGRGLPSGNMESLKFPL
jgi:hypothetical protein